MELDLEICRTIAIRYGLPLQFVFKEFHLMNVIAHTSTFVSKHPDSLVFKGGTALNKVYLQKTQRFSEDADFDLVMENSRMHLLKFSRELADSLEEYRIEEFRKVHSTLQFYCTYTTPLGGADHVRIDIAPKKLLTAKPLARLQITSTFTHSSVTGISMYSIEDLTARKMNALASRSEGKDMYDVHAALPMCSKKVLKKAIISMLESEGAKEGADEFVYRAINNVKKSDIKKLRNLTNPFIPAMYRPKSWEELKNDMLMQLDTLR